jgi:uncharacterized protein YcnI
MLQSNVLLYNITHKKTYLQEAQRLAEASHNYFYRGGRYPSNYWFNAVLLRGYIALYDVDRQKKYIQSVMQDAERIWQTETDEQMLAGASKAKKLLDQAGLLEIYARLARVLQEGF